MGNEIKLCWLGQSGFLVRAGDTVLLADPYLSDSCAKLKSKLDHTRGTPIVRDPADLKVDWYLITHCHADHFEPVTIEYCEKLGMKTLLPEAGKEFYL